MFIVCNASNSFTNATFKPNCSKASKCKMFNLDQPSKFATFCGPTG